MTSSSALHGDHTQALTGFHRFHRLPQGSTGSQRVPQGSTGTHRVPPGSTGTHRVPQRDSELLQSENKESRKKNTPDPLGGRSQGSEAPRSLASGPGRAFGGLGSTCHHRLPQGSTGTHRLFSQALWKPVRHRGSLKPVEACQTLWKPVRPFTSLCTLVRPCPQLARSFGRQTALRALGYEGLCPKYHATELVGQLPPICCFLMPCMP